MYSSNTIVPAEQAMVNGKEEHLDITTFVNTTNDLSRILSAI